MAVCGTTDTHRCVYFRTNRLVCGGCRAGERWALGERRGVVQKARQMDHLDIRARRAKARGHLQDAPRIRAHDDIRPRVEDPRDLVALEGLRDVRMREVVDARAAAAPLGIPD